MFSIVGFNHIISSIFLFKKLTLNKTFARIQESEKLWKKIVHLLVSLILS